MAFLTVSFCLFAGEYTVERLDCQSKGKNMVGELYMPSGAEGKLPVVVMGHGYNSSAYECEEYAKLLAEHGIASYVLEFCGGSSTSRSEGETTEMSVFTESRNFIDATKMLRKRKDIDRKQIFLLGCSQGGLVSAITTAAKPRMYRAQILVYPALMIGEHAVTLHPKEALTSEEGVEVMGMKLSHVYYDRLLKYDVYSKLKKYRRPTMIVVGSEDEMIAGDVAQKASQGYKDCEVNIIPGGKHGFPDPENKRIAANYILKFVKKHIKSSDHGVNTFYYDADRGGRKVQKSAEVYTPACYDKNDHRTRYNVLYLLHGGGDCSKSFFDGSHGSEPLGQILDSLIACKAIDPLIVVGATYYERDDKKTMGMEGTIVDCLNFHEELHGWLIPAMEDYYNVAAGREHRAYGGFSMGALSTWYQLCYGLEDVKYYIPLSGDLWTYDDDSVKQSAEESARWLNDRIGEQGFGPDDFVVIAHTGSKDIAYEPETALVEAIKEYAPVFKYGENLTYTVFEDGDHSYRFINQYLKEDLPKLFK